MFTRRGFVLGAVYSTMTLASSSGRADAQGGPETPHKIPLKIEKNRISRREICVRTGRGGP